jgi:D-alanine-D-alanine ligase
MYTYNDYLSGDSLLEYPSIVKPLNGGSSIGIYVVNNKKEERDVLLKAFEVSKELLVQKYYDNIVEYNLAIDSLGESHLERIVKKDNIFSFNNKYNESFKQMHQAIDDDLLYDDFKEIGRNVYTLIKAKGIIRIDFFLIDGVIYVNEINIIPGALAMYLYEDFNSVVTKEIEMELLRKDKVYSKGNFLISSNIHK